MATIWLFTRVAKDLKLGQLITNPVNDQSKTQTQHCEIVSVRKLEFSISHKSKRSIFVL